MPGQPKALKQAAGGAPRISSGGPAGCLSLPPGSPSSAAPLLPTAAAQTSRPPVQQQEHTWSFGYPQRRVCRHSSAREGGELRWQTRSPCVVRLPGGRCLSGSLGSWHIRETPGTLPAHPLASAHLLRLADASGLDNQVVKPPLPGQGRHLLQRQSSRVGGTMARQEGRAQGTVSRRAQPSSQGTLRRRLGELARACSRSSRRVQQMQPFCISTSRSWVCSHGRGWALGLEGWDGGGLGSMHVPGSLAAGMRQTPPTPTPTPLPPPPPPTPSPIPPLCVVAHTPSMC